jgi:hypothetical protein
MEMILHQDVTVHLHPVALRPFGQIAQKPHAISVIPENLFPSISARHGVVQRAGNSIPGGRDILAHNDT